MLPARIELGSSRCYTPTRLMPQTCQERLGADLGTVPSDSQSHQTAVVAVITQLRRLIMSHRRKIIWRRAALAIVVTVFGGLTASAQNRSWQIPGPYTPKADARDLKAVLFNWMWHTGMLKGQMSGTWSHPLNIRAKARSRWRDNFARSQNIVPARTTRASVNGSNTPAHGRMDKPTRTSR
jgi:hypothetical protein